jgi:AcrR family transcriptional regulator
MARPKTITDQKLIEAAYDLIMAQGPQGLTFERLGQEVGLVPAALVRRFANKQQFMAEVDRYALARSNESLKAVLAREDSPIEAIIAGFVAELSFATTIERFIHGQEFLLMDLATPDLYANYQASFTHRYKTVVKLLQTAQERGELSSSVDVHELARLLQTILHGAGHVWAMSQEGPVEDHINKYVRLALKPYQYMEEK